MVFALQCVVNNKPLLQSSEMLGHFLLVKWYSKFVINNKYANNIYLCDKLCIWSCREFMTLISGPDRNGYSTTTATSLATT